MPQDAGKPLHQRGEWRGDLRFLTPSGLEVQYAAAFGPDEHDRASGPFRCRNVRMAEGWEVLQQRVPREASTVGTRDLLEREVCGALAIFKAYARSRHAVLFPLLVGYDLDADEPFVLYPGTRGSQPRPVRPATCAASAPGRPAHHSYVSSESTDSAGRAVGSAARAALSRRAGLAAVAGGAGCDVPAGAA